MYNPFSKTNQFFVFKIILFEKFARDLQNTQTQTQIPKKLKKTYPELNLRVFCVHISDFT